jgi:hypothetical protein
MKRTFRVATSVAAILIAGSAFAQHAGKGNAYGRDDDKGAGDGGAQAAIDASGRLRPVTSDEARELLSGLAPFVSQSSAGLVEVVHASGAVSIDLQDRFQSVSMARLGLDGTVLMRCIGTEADARHFLLSTSSIAALRPAPRRGVQSTPALEEK